jgi:hypothetical protein
MLIPEKNQVSWFLILLRNIREFAVELTPALTLRTLRYPALTLR